MKYHYTYRITNIILNKHYYGVRTSKIIPKDDLGNNYFSSSSDTSFIQDQKSNPKDYKYKVIRISNSREYASQLEIKLHNKFDVGVNESFYNRAKATTTGFDRTGISYSMDESTKLKIGLAHKDKTVSVESRQKISQTRKELSLAKGENNPMYGTSRIGEENPFFGRNHSIKTLEKIKQTNLERYGETSACKLQSVKDKISKSKLDVRQETKTCPHCQKAGGASNMKRYHFDNCKLKTQKVNTIF